MEIKKERITRYTLVVDQEELNYLAKATERPTFDDERDGFNPAVTVAIWEQLSAKATPAE